VISGLGEGSWFGLRVSGWGWMKYIKKRQEEWLKLSLS